MAREQRRRARRKKAVREFIVEACTGAGAFLGLLVALPVIFDAKATACDDGSDGQLAIGECLAEAVSAAVIPALLMVAGGAVIGLVVAALMIRAIRPLRDV
jgi:hypothetical protein